MQEDASLMTSPDGTEVFFILSQQELIKIHKQTPDSFYIKGIMQDGKFVPKSQVLGLGDLATKGRYGWLELQSQEFYPMESDQMAVTPFVKGYMTDKGFIPSSRDVIDEPK